MELRLALFEVLPRLRRTPRTGIDGPYAAAAILGKRESELFRQRDRIVGKVTQIP